MAGGRPKKALKLNVLHGNPGKRSADNLPTPAVLPSVPSPPRYLSRHAKREWRIVAPILHDLGLLTKVDRAALEAYCESYSTWRVASEALKKQGQTFTTPNGYVQQRPEIAIANNSLKMMKIFMTEFGLTPASRAKMVVAGPEEEDIFEKYLAKKK
jgi:P27 family predicted phage terminase small subunit